MKSDSSNVERVYVGKRTQFTNESRQLVKCGVRNIAVVCYKDELYAIDNACYHHGGPLLRGDIEELGGHPCIVCPWHSYKIALDTGEGLYMGIAIGPSGGAPQQTVKSKGCKQRVHKVVVDDANDVYVLVDLSGPKWESDAYASMELANREQPTRSPMEGEGGGPRPPGIHSNIAFGMRSGQVFQQLGLVHTGRGGTNPFNARQKTRPPVSPALPGAGGGHKADAHVTNLFVSCTSIVEVCAGVREFHFAHHSGPLLRHAELGEHVELELPIKEVRDVSSDSVRRPSAFLSSSLAAGGEMSFAAANGDDGLMRRRWTICDVNRKGSLFTLMVKAAGSDPRLSGSAWLHQRSLHTPLRVCGVGGTFTFADHLDTIRRLRGHMLWVTAGIGITSAYAAMNSSLDDTFFAEGKEPLHVVHLHANHTLATVPKLDDFVRWQRRFPREDARRENLVGRGKKTYVMELFISPPTEAAEGHVAGMSGPVSPPLPSTPVTHRRRLLPKDLLGAVQKYFGADLPLAYVCGPPNFVSACTDALLSAGLPEAHILTDDA